MSQVLDLLADVTTHTKAYAAARSLYADRLAPEFSPFQFINTNEMGLSKLIGWMLDPNGSHAQGGCFLAAFAEIIEIELPEAFHKAAIVEIESPTEFLQASRRIDILVRWEKWALAIENKPRAADQKAQVSDYFVHLDKKFEKPCLVYLSGDGSGPTEYSISKDAAAKRMADKQLIVMGYQQLYDWAGVCKTRCRADRVAVFLDHFMSYLQQEFIGGGDMTETDHIVSDIVTSTDRISAALTIANASNKIKTQLMSELVKQLSSLAAEHGWGITPDKSLEGATRGISIQFKPLNKYDFRIEFDNAKFKSLCYGMKARETSQSQLNGGKSPESPPIDTDLIHDLLNKAISPGTKTLWWPWYRYSNPNDTNRDCLLAVDVDWSVAIRPWVEISNGTLAPKIIAVAEKFEEALKDYDLQTSPITLLTATFTPLSSPN